MDEQKPRYLTVFADKKWIRPKICMTSNTSLWLFFSLYLIKLPYLCHFKSDFYEFKPNYSMAHHFRKCEKWIRFLGPNYTVNVQNSFYKRSLTYLECSFSRLCSTTISVPGPFCNKKIIMKQCWKNITMKWYWK